MSEKLKRSRDLPLSENKILLLLLYGALCGVTLFVSSRRFVNDYDVQMLLADNSKALEIHAEAERHYQLAAAMCPSRLTPLYELAKLYEATGRKDEATATAKKGLEKDEKIQSSTTAAIKSELQRLLTLWEAANDPAHGSRTSDNPDDAGTRQGETPKVQPDVNSN
jgi:tetratricopeptide (TPR) repeat protein